MRFPGRQLAAALAALCAAVWASQAEVIDDILGGLSRAATFLERHHEQINLDGLVGFIILQGWYRKTLATGLCGAICMSAAKTLVTPSL